jgi:predicted small metal-binding protein
MTKVVRCLCGYTARSGSEEELVAAVQRHVRDVHSMEITAEQVIAMAHPE